MGFKCEPWLVFENLMKQHVFGSRYILNPVTNEPWILAASSFAHIWSNTPVTIADLYYLIKLNTGKALK